MPAVEQLEERALLSGGPSISGNLSGGLLSGTSGSTPGGYPVPPTTMPMPSNPMTVTPPPPLVLPTLNGSPGGSASTTLSGPTSGSQGTSGGPGPTATIIQPSGSSGTSGSSGGPSQPL